MADDVNPALRVEINAAIDAIGPGIEGLIDLMRKTASEEFLTRVTDKYNVQVARETALWKVIRALDALNAAMQELRATGYPNVDKVVVPGRVFEDFEKQKAEEEAAFALFEGEPTASNVAITFGNAEDTAASRAQKK